ncbi:glycosyltransferase family 4 protein [Mucilaginibacter ginsenosidivorax]|uniref:Glycosyltransferase n=1 Tax=Mucilaginibacter ginsenosidivorax TaxID=862126 RepID=A0A5B8W4R1_9SPHI|nr:glycosyltransferase [Mucilaginibacter ginsenosidivorax]QEC77922.1 glycosyltransferase [Mucilaginibacter ginsenosidivorax]
MKVVFCAYDGKDIINGINTWLIRLLPALANRGIEVSAIFIAWAAEKDCTTIPKLRALGIKCTVIPTAHYTEKQANWMLRYLQAENADVFIPGNMVPALHAAKWANEAGIPTVAVLHNDDAEYAAIIDQFVAEPNDTNLSAVVTVSEALYKSVQGRNKNIKLYKIPCGAPVPKQKAILKPGTTFKVVYIGRIVKEQKRIDEITTCFCECAQNFPDVVFYIYGSGPDAALVNTIINAYNNPENVFFAGSILPEDVQQVLLSSHTFVLMSDYEGIPVALMEAMACGVVPVCKLINSGIPELVHDGATGLFTNGTKGLLSKIEYLKHNPGKWEELSLNCQKLITDQFSSDKNLASWTELFNDLAGRQKKRIAIPSRLNLPPPHPYFEGLDRREPPMLVKAYKKLKRILNN